MPKHRRMTAAIVLAIACTVGAAAAFALSDPGSSVSRTVEGEPPEGSAADAARPVTREVPAAVRSAFAVFRRPQRSEDRLSRAAVAPLGGDAASARLVVPGARPSTTYYAVPAPPGLCLVSGSGSGACTTVGSAVGTGIVASRECSEPGQVLIFGVAPDDVDVVTLADPGGRTTEVPVQSNGWARLAPQTPVERRPSRLVLEGDSGPLELQVPYSPDVEEPC